MIKMYTGTIGSGKSLHMARDIRFALVNKKQNVIANFPIDMNKITKNGTIKTGEFIYLSNEELTVKYLIKYSIKNHKGKEGETLLFIDEAGIKFNSRLYGDSDRMQWIKFFVMSRKLGFYIILASQKDRLLDRQIRGFVEYEIRHRNANKFKLIGLLLTLLRINIFVAVKIWYGMNEKDSSEIFRYRKKDGELYDTMLIFDLDFYNEALKEISDETAEAEADITIDMPQAPALAENGEGPRKRKGSPLRPKRTPAGKQKEYVCNTADCNECIDKAECTNSWKLLTA
ncbi:MAG: zonular occludens toxin domain-containing protein [Oscillospiraceae bacterium]|nr:zonular occludens toxin domain-containing protein [Oscillospiraceae bacterium]